MNLKTEMFITIILGILCDIILAFVFHSIKEFPIWAGFVIFALFNICIGMVIFAYLIRGEETKMNETRLCRSTEIVKEKK